MTKLTVSIDLSDLFVEKEVNRDDGGYVEFNFKEELQSAVMDEVKREVRSMASSEIKSVIASWVEQELKTEIRASMRTHLIDFLTTKKLTNDRYGGSTVDEFLQNQFAHEIGNSGQLAREVSGLAAKWGSNLKAQYDAAFATRIVEKLNEEGLLLPNVAQLLLAPKSN